jgi:uncharacterized protein Yka (UPF0111/DUF47 family)
LKPTRWFLPQAPDVLGMLSQQGRVTADGIEAFVAWAHGDAARADDVRRAEHEADELKREIRRSLRDSFVTPLDPEDLFVLSKGLDGVLNGAKDCVREAEVMATPPDEAMAEMAELIALGVDRLCEAVAQLGSHDDDATVAADAAVKAERQLEKTYRRAMSSLLEQDDLRAVMGRRELYRRLSRIGEGVADTAERVWYAVVKEG